MGDLDKLIEAVRRGADERSFDTLVWASDLCRGNCGLYTRAFGGSLDAAVELLKGLVPGWRWSLAQDLEIIGSDATFLAVVAPMDSTRREHVFRPSGRHGDPARALLLAALRAYGEKRDG